MRLARCLSPLNSKLSPVGRGYSWMGDHLGIASCWLSNLELMWAELLISPVLRGFFSGFSGFPPSVKWTPRPKLWSVVSCRMAAAKGAFNMLFDLTTLICILRNSAMHWLQVRTISPLSFTIYSFQSITTTYRHGFGAWADKNPIKAKKLTSYMNAYE